MSTITSTVDEVTVENITDQLLKRSQDAIWQLECWIQKQENDVNISTTLLSDDNNNNHSNNAIDSQAINVAKQKQQLYVKQLKSLQRRSLYLKHNINPTNSNENSPFLTNESTFDQQEVVDLKNLNKNNNRNSVHSIQDDVSYMENLVFEFKDLTIKLNELAKTRKSVNLNNTINNNYHNKLNDADISRSSSSSSSSDDSLELKPLRIISRQNITSTTKQHDYDENIEVTSSPNSETHSSTHKRKKLLMSSLPNSPIRSKSNQNLQSPKKLNNHKLRTAKSYHDGLINTSVRDNMTRQQTVNPFNKNNRLSLALFQNMKNVNDEEDDENGVIYSDDDLEFIDDNNITQDELDQDTVMLPYDNNHNKYVKTPILTPKLGTFPPLQRSNSHDSIFSKRSVKKPLRFYQFVTNTTAQTTRSVSTNDSINTSLENTTVISQPMFFKSSSNSNGTSSKALLSDIINSKPITPAANHRNPIRPTTTIAATTTSSIFANWSLFGKKAQSNIISETGVRNTRTGTLKIKNDPRRPSNASSVMVSAVIKHNKEKTKKLSPSKKPIIDLDIRHNDLQDALNTELLL